SQELLSVKDIKDKINNPENLKAINDNIEIKIEEYLNQTFPEKYPMMSMLVGKKTRVKLKNDFLSEVEQITPGIIEKYVDNLEQGLDVENIIRQKVTLLSPATLETLIMSVLKREFQFIELIGALLGFFIGVIQVL